MGEDEREEVFIEELAFAGLVQAEAITRLLIQKGIFTKDEFYQKVRVVKVEQQGQGN